MSVSVMKSKDNFVIYDTHKANEISLEEMVKKSADFDVIFFGEFHDDSLNHSIQAAYLQSLYESGIKANVSLEMFERDVQKHLDNYLSGNTDEEEFLKNSRPWPDYKKFYKPLVEIPKQFNSKVIAANIPRKYAAMYVSGGMTAYSKLSDEEKSNIASTMVLSEDSYLDKFLETMTGSSESAKSLTHNKLNTLYLYYGAQCIKDETMAESILNYYNSEPKSKIIHFNGDFHSNSYLGTVNMLQRRAPKLKIAVITVKYYDKIDSIEFSSDLKNEADFVLFLPKYKREDFPQMMGGSSHFGENFVTEHNIEVEINPEKSFLKGIDRIKFNNPILKSSSLKLLKALEIKKMSSPDNNLKFTVNSTDDYYNEIIVENISLKNQTYDNGGIKESFDVVIEYEGVVNFAPSETNMIKRHSNTPGLISGKENEGIYLPGGAYYPQTDKDLAKFNIYVTLPSEYKLIASGEVLENIGTKNTVYQVKSESNYDEVILVAARFKSMKKVHDSVSFEVYYYNEAPHNEKYLDESIKYYDEYTKLFGKYPYKSFKIVENFFATGFGMPGYTLLSNRLMAMPWVTLSPGSLAHEFVHNWWGNSVFVDYSTGNWCEALTTYSTNYYYNIITGNQKEALDWRRKALISIDALPSDKNYPVSEFKYQKDTYDAVIGYSKGAFVIEEIRKILGDKLFFDALKSFASKFSGKRAYWMNLTSEFVNIAKDTLKDIKIRNVINDWIKTKEIPNLKFTNSPIVANDSVTISITSDIKRVMSVPVSLHFIDNNEIEKHYVLIKDTLNQFTFPINKKLKSIALDNELESLRKLYHWEKPFSFNRVLSSKPILILPEKTSPDYAIAMKYVNTMKESGYDFEYYTHDNVPQAELNHSSLILLGSAKSNKITAEYSKQLPQNLKLSKDGFSYDGKFTDFKDDIMMANVEHLHSKEKFVSIIYYDNLADVSPLNRLIHYQSYSLVLLNSKRSGRPTYNCEIYPVSTSKSEIFWDN